MSLDVTGRYRYPSPNVDWLSLGVEDVIDPDLPIIDAHHHLWVEGGAPYLLQEITADVTDGHTIASTVFVQAHFGYRTDLPQHLAPVGETEKVAAIAAKAVRANLPTRIAEGIVAHADLTLGASVSEVIEAHDYAAKGALRGIRHSVSRDEHFPNGIVLRPAPPALLSDPRYRAGLAALMRHDLSYDAMLYHAQIDELTAVAKAMPSLQIVLDHLGCVLGVGYYADRPAERFRAWQRAMSDLSRCANVSVKFGGLGMIICGARWHEGERPPSSTELATAWRPYFDACMDLFGPERCMFESNFPVDKAMYSYRTLWNAFKRLTTGFGDGERHALFAGTASRVYRLCDPAPVREAIDA